MRTTYDKSNYDTVSEDDANGKDVGVDGQGHFAVHKPDAKYFNND